VIPSRLSYVVALLSLLSPVAGRAAGAQPVADDFERAKLAEGPLRWQAKGAWGIRSGQLVAPYAGREKWPNDTLALPAPKSMPIGGIVRVDAVHASLVGKPGYLALVATDSESEAYVEWVSHVDRTAVECRTSDTAPAFKPLPKSCEWVANQPASYAIRWKGYDEETGEGTVELLFTPKAGAEDELFLAAEVAVKGLRDPDHFALVINAEEQAAAAPTMAFDNFHLELSEGPDAPLGFAPQEGCQDRVRLTWEDVADEEAYLLQRAAGPAGQWEPLARLPADVIIYEDREARRSLPYRYRLRAVNERGRSSWTPAAEVLLPGPPLAPSDLRAEVRACGRVSLEWHNNAVNARQFVVERQEREGQPWVTFKATPPSVVSTVDWVPPHGAVRYRVRAVNAHGASPWSEVPVARRPKPPPTVVAPADRVIHNRPDTVPVTSIEVLFDQPVQTTGPHAPDHFTIAAACHPWHPLELPSPEITSVAFDAQGRRARIVFSPPIPDLVEYRIGVGEGVTGLDGVPVAAPLVRVAVLLGDDDRDGFVAPAPGELLGKRLAMPPLPVGIMGEDIEWNKVNGAHNVEHITELMDANEGIDFFRVNLWWDVLEPKQGEFEPKYVSFLHRVLAAAQERQLPLEIGIRQERWPLWVCNHAGFSNRLYEAAAAARFADTWRRVAAICREYPVVFAYWPISEEYPGERDVPSYLACLRGVADALRAAHPGCVIKVRPAAVPFLGGHDVTPIVSQRGPQDMCMAAGVYPTGWQMDIQNPNPLTAGSFTNMQAFRCYPTEIQGGPNSIGEIGFRAAEGARFGDPERLVAFQRVMALAHDLGLIEYVIWGESWTFSDPATFLPRLLAFRDLLIQRPRRPGFDLRLVNDNNTNFAHPPYTQGANPDLSHLFRWLEERGYRFFITVPAAMKHQKGEFEASVAFSELLKLTPAEQVALLHEKLAGIAPSGVVLPWLDRRAYYQSLTGLPCNVEIEFPGAEGICDAVSLSPALLQIYAPPGTLVRWRKPGGDDWNDFVTPEDSRIAFLDIGTR